MSKHAPVLLLALLSGCPKDEPASPPAAADPPALLDPTPPIPAKPMTPLALPRREIMVGGCMDDCDRPEKAVQHLLAAALRGDAAEVKRFIDTSVLVHDGHDHGGEWARLYLDGKLDERREGIEKWLKDWLSWVDRVQDPADRTRAPAGITVVEENQHRHVVTYRHPDLAREGRATGDVWRLVFATRGLEWLVAEIEDRPERK